MSVVCAIDQSEHEDRAALHRYLRKLGVKQVDYYQNHEPRRDLLTNEIIPFKAPAEHYLTLDFIDKNNLRKFIKTNTPAAQQWAKDWLRKRRDEKRLIYPPSQVELRSLAAPGIAYYDYIGGYSTICNQIGYSSRFTLEELHSSPLPSNTIFIEDTRENTPLSINAKTIQQKLPYGDYALAAPHDKGIYIERKSLGDFVNTLSNRKIDRCSGDDSNFARFTRELERAAEAGAYIVMLVESGINDALGFNFLPQFSRRFGQHFDPKTRRMIPCEYRGVLPEHIFHNLRELLTRFPLSFQALFVKNREEAAVAVVRLLAAGDSVKQVDLEYAYESKRLVFIP